MALDESFMYFMDVNGSRFATVYGGYGWLLAADHMCVFASVLQARARV